MKELKCYKLDNGKYVWTNDLDAFKGTIFEGRIILHSKKKTP